MQITHYLFFLYYFFKKMLDKFKKICNDFKNFLQRINNENKCCDGIL